MKDVLKKGGEDDDDDDDGGDGEEGEGAEEEVEEEEEEEDRGGNMPGFDQTMMMFPGLPITTMPTGDVRKRVERALDTVSDT